MTMSKIARVSQLGNARLQLNLRRVFWLSLCFICSRFSGEAAEFWGDFLEEVLASPAPLPHGGLVVL